MAVVYSLIRWVVFAVLTCGLLYACNCSDWARKQDQAQKAQQLAEETPHVIRHADGCSVYKFQDGGNPHYFTRCKGSDVVTESEWTERHDKQLVQKSESIPTHEEN